MYFVPEFRARTVENLTACGVFPHVGLWPGTSNDLFAKSFRLWDGIMIDGDHVAPQPLLDAANAKTRIKPNGVILLHDANKPPIQQAYKHLESGGWKVKFYNTIHGVAVCYRDGFTPPEVA
jgi:hypothetical protein